MQHCLLGFAVTSCDVASRRGTGFAAIALTIVALASCGPQSSRDVDDFVVEKGLAVDPSCLSTALTEAGLPASAAELGAEALSTGDRTSRDAAVRRCLDLSAPAIPSLDAARPPGTDPELDELWLSCGQGVAADCDSLFTRSPIGSDYEAFGLTCGARAYGDCDEIVEAAR